MRGALIALAAAACLSACAVMDADDCRQANWRQLGEKDALAGRTLARLDERTQACAKHQIGANAGDYRAGHQQGQAAYCTGQRGYSDAAAGRTPTTLCREATAAVWQTYDSGFDTGLRNVFCQPRNAYEWARAGNADPQTCPEALRLDFETGYRLGREVLELRRSADQTAEEAARLRRLATDDKLKPDERQRASRRAAELDADEYRLRANLRQAELSALGLPPPSR